MSSVRLETRIQALLDGVLPDDQRAEGDRVLDQGSRLTVSQGTVALTFASGVHSVLVAPSSIVVQDAASLLMNEGEAWIHVADRDSARELRLSRTPAGETQLVFSYDGSALVDWDIALSKDLITWKTIAKEVDYRVVQTEQWTPAGSSESLTRITIETMDGSSFDFEPREPANFFKLAVTPSS